MKIKTLIFVGLSALAAVGVAFAQTTNGPVVPNAPTISSVGVNDVFQDIVGGFPQVQSQYVSAPNLAGFVGNVGASANFLIGGKADQNLWQRATTGSSVTTTLTYGGPDRWAYWSGTSTAMTVSKVSTAAALPTGSANVFRMQRTASQTGVVQMCMAQEITSTNSYYLQGHTVLLDFNVYTGANFSGSGLTAYVSYGTGTDQGLAGTSSYAYGLNAGGGGSGSWTGQANATAAVIPLAAVSTAYRVAAVASIPTTATEIAVALCYTPVGTAGTTDALYFDNIELRKVDMLANFVNTAAGYVLSSNVITATINGAVQNVTIPAFSYRLNEDEARNQYAYYYQINEFDTAGVVQGPAGYYVDTTHCQIAFPLPVPMRASPVIQNSSITTSTFTVAQLGGTPAGGVALAGTGNSGLILAVGAAPSAPFTVGVGSFITTTKTQYAGCALLSTASGAGNFGFSAEL
jgi:hypothetical protein